MLTAMVEPSLLLQLLLFTLGVTYVITRSEIGFLIRWPWCRLTKGIYQRIGGLLSPWSPVLCPACNGWWVGAALAFWAGYGWMTVLQVAFTACGLIAILQQMLGGDIAPADDFESILGLKEREDGH